jgi:glycerophosphoryl diester phosphodiesterase
MISTELRYPRVIAHRCGGILAGENTLAGLLEAARIGCRGVEFDVMLSADGMPVLIHDETVDRTTDGSGRVAELTVAQLRSLDAGGEPVPLLDEALARCRDLGLWANIELKPSTGLDHETGRIVAAVLAARWDGRGVISSFSREALAAARREAPQLPCALIADQLPSDWLAVSRDLALVGLHVAAAGTGVASIAAVREAGLAYACYTVNDCADARKLLAAGVSAVFTDRPELLCAEEM